MDTNQSTTPVTDPNTLADSLKRSQDRISSLIEGLRIAEERATAGQLALEVMHEIKNPLEVIGHVTYLAGKEADHPEKVRIYMDLAEEQMKTIGRICSQTLSFARTADKAAPTDLAVIAQAALRVHQRKIDEKKIHLLKKVSEGAIAHVHMSEILQVLSNLITNALDAMPAHGVLHLRIRKRYQTVELVIADNGHGIPPNQAETIFEPFFTTKEGRGTGLGLALSKRIVDRHSGQIKLRSSVRQGKSGTAFRITLPCSAK